ncbi:MAG: ABC transporter permease [Candidatus Sulfopaludibacter sp.]|nr:ABC transporter permease [Candidatus Sulfopaludibacter sp.]
MTALRVLISRLGGLFATSARLDEEIAAHLDMLAGELERRGLSPAAARAQARRDFGAITPMREVHRDQRRLPFFDTLAQDLRYALRQLRRSPGFAAAAILTLALGIGANAAIYQVLDAVVFRALPVPHPEQLVLMQLVRNGKPLTFSYPLYREMAARQRVLAGTFAASTESVVLRGRRGIETVHTSLVTGNYFQVLGVSARRGRCFTGADDRAAAPVAVISHAFWQREFAGATALGANLQLNRAMVTVIGIMPPAFFGESAGDVPDIWLPIGMQPLLSPSDWLDAPAFSWLKVTARLKPDVSPTQAATALTALYRQLPGLGSPDYQVQLQPANQILAELNAQTAHPLYILIGITAAVLLIACCNLANLLLGRAAARTHEIGVRLAIGAGRARIVRHLLTESFLLSTLGTLAAGALAWWGSRALIQAQAWHLAVNPTWRALGFTAGIAILATLLFGLVPALSATHFDLLPALAANRRTHSGGRSGQWLGKLLIVVQISTSLLLLSGAALLGLTLWNLRHQDFGFSRGNVLMVDLPVEFGPNMASRSNAVRPVLYDRLQTLPGVRSAAFSACGLMSAWQNTGPISSAERPARKTDYTRFTVVTPHYFETLGIPLIAGRAIDERDRDGAPQVAVLSETAAHTLFGGTNPIGRMVSGSYTFEAGKAFEVVGVAHDVRFSPRDPYAFQIYRPFSKSGFPITEVVVRTAGDPASLVGPVRAAIQDLDPSLAVGDVSTLQQKIDSGLVHERMMALLSGCFGLLALILTSVGVYGVIAYAVARRTREIGIRLALGAARGQVAAMLLRELGPLVLASLVLGAGATLAATRVIRTQLYGVAAGDLTTLGAAACAIALVAALAAWLPARRASRLDPMDALRQQ